MALETLTMRPRSTGVQHVRQHGSAVRAIGAMTLTSKACRNSAAEMAAVGPRRLDGGGVVDQDVDVDGPYRLRGGAAARCSGSPRSAAMTWIWPGRIPRARATACRSPRGSLADRAISMRVAPATASSRATACPIPHVPHPSPAPSGQRTELSPRPPLLIEGLSLRQQRRDGPSPLRMDHFTQLAARKSDVLPRCGVRLTRPGKTAGRRDAQTGAGTGQDRHQRLKENRHAPARPR